MTVIDYVFYRIYSFYKTRKDSTPIFMGCAVLAIIFYFTLLSLMFIIGTVLKKEYHLNKAIIVLFLLVAIVVFVKRFGNKQFVFLLENKYSEEELGKKKRHTLFILLYALFVFSIPIVYGVLKHNYHMDI